MWRVGKEVPINVYDGDRLPDKWAAEKRVE